MLPDCDHVCTNPRANRNSLDKRSYETIQPPRYRHVNMCESSTENRIHIRHHNIELNSPQSSSSDESNLPLYVAYKKNKFRKLVAKRARNLKNVTSETSIYPHQRQIPTSRASKCLTSSQNFKKDPLEGGQVDIGPMLSYAMQNIRLCVTGAYDRSVDEQYECLKSNVDEFNGVVNTIFVNGKQSFFNSEFATLEDLTKTFCSQNLDHMQDLLLKLYTNLSQNQYVIILRTLSRMLKPNHLHTCTETGGNVHNDESSNSRNPSTSEPNQSTNSKNAQKFTNETRQIVAFKSKHCKTSKHSTRKETAHTSTGNAQCGEHKTTGSQIEETKPKNRRYKMCRSKFTCRNATAFDRKSGKEEKTISNSFFMMEGVGLSRLQFKGKVDKTKNTKYVKSRKSILLNEKSRQKNSIFEPEGYKNSVFLLNNERNSVFRFRSSEKIASAGFRSAEKIDSSGFRSSEKIDSTGFRSSEKIDSTGFRSSEKIDSTGFRSSEKIESTGFRSAEKIDSRGFRSAEKIDSTGFRPAGKIDSREVSAPQDSSDSDLSQGEIRNFSNLFHNGGTIEDDNKSANSKLFTNNKMVQTSDLKLTSNRNSQQYLHRTDLNSAPGRKSDNSKISQVSSSVAGKTLCIMCSKTPLLVKWSRLKIGDSLPIVRENERKFAQTTKASGQESDRTENIESVEQIENGKDDNTSLMSKNRYRNSTVNFQREAPLDYTNDVDVETPGNRSRIGLAHCQLFTKSEESLEEYQGQHSRQSADTSVELTEVIYAVIEGLQEVDNIWWTMIEDMFVRFVRTMEATFKTGIRLQFQQAQLGLHTGVMEVLQDLGTNLEAHFKTYFREQNDAVDHVLTHLNLIFMNKFEKS